MAQNTLCRGYSNYLEANFRFSHINFHVLLIMQFNKVLITLHHTHLETCVKELSVMLNLLTIRDILSSEKVTNNKQT